MELTNVKEVVKAALEKNEKCRDSDTRLVAVIWNHFLKEDIAKMSAMELLAKLAKNELPNFESIRRVRQRLQELDESLRGPNYKQRKKEETKIKQELKTL